MDAAIIAVGCTGGCMANHMAGRIKAAYLAINTDRRELDACRVGRKILIGEQRFQGRGGANPHLIMEGSAAALVAIKMLAGVDRLVTVPLGELLRRGVSEEDVLRAGDKLVARAVARLMVPEGWKVPVERKGRGRAAALTVQGE